MPFSQATIYQVAKNSEIIFSVSALKKINRLLYMVYYTISLYE